MKGGQGDARGPEERGGSLSADSMHQMIGRAITDRRFREDLIRSPLDAIREYSFSNWERELIGSLQAASLEEFARKLKEGLEDRSNGRAGPQKLTG